VDSLTTGQEFPESRVLEVSKLRIKKEELQLPFLGNWIFRQITIADDSIDLEKTLVAGKLALSQGEANQWSGTRVRIDAKRNWRIRPGDVVQVDLSSKRDSSGLFVPMDAVVHQGDKTFLVLLENEADGIAKVKKTEVRLLPRDKNFSTSSMREVEPIGNEDLIGQTYVSKGAHFLIDGQQVRVVGQSANRPDSKLDSATESTQ
jgi:translation initiation factor IF-1